MKKRLLLFPLLMILAGCAQDGSTLPTEKLVIHNQTFTVEIANTPEQRNRGLMYRDSMPARHGMIFLFERSAAVGFWMKNTRIPLDIIYMSQQGAITGIFTLQPYDETGVQNPPEARIVLELNAGQARELNLKTGDTLRLPANILKQLPSATETQ